MDSAEEKIVINQGMNSEGLHHKEDHSLPDIQISFMVIVLILPTLDNGHKVVDCRAYGRSDTYVDPHNIECYKCHNYGHIAQNFRIMIEPSMK